MIRLIAGQRRRLRVPQIDHATLAEHALGGTPAAGDLLVISTEQHFMTAIERLEAAGEVDVEYRLLAPARHIAAPPVGTGVGVLVHRAIGDDAFGGGVVIGVGIGRVELPVFVEVVVKLGEPFAGVAIGPGLVGGVPGMPRQAQVTPGAVARQAVTGAVFFDLVVAATKGQHGVVGDVRFQHTIKKGLLGATVIHEVLTVGVGRDHAPTQLAVKGQRPGQVDFAAVVVPGTGRGVELELVVVQWALAHQVDHAAWITGTGQQAAGTAQDFNVVVGSHVIDTVAVKRTDTGADVHRRGAVDLHVVDTKAARVELLRMVVVVAQGDARGSFHGLGQGGDTLVFDHLLSDDRHRLRGVLEAHWRLGADTDQPGGIGTGVLGGFTHALADDAGAPQLHCSAGTGGVADDHRVAFDPVGQASITQDDVEGGARLHVAGHCSRTLATDQTRLEQQLQTGLLTELGQRFAQGCRGNVDLFAFGLGRAGHAQREPQYHRRCRCAPVSPFPDRGAPRKPWLIRFHVLNYSNALLCWTAADSEVG
ncbi:hypothetical protein D3C79_640960 [compost metagenome]